MTTPTIPTSDDRPDPFVADVNALLARVAQAARDPRTCDARTAHALAADVIDEEVVALLVDGRADDMVARPEAYREAKRAASARIEEQLDIIRRPDHHAAYWGITTDSAEGEAALFRLLATRRDLDLVCAELEATHDDETRQGLLREGTRLLRRIRPGIKAAGRSFADHWDVPVVAAVYQALRALLATTPRPWPDPWQAGINETPGDDEEGEVPAPLEPWGAAYVLLAQVTGVRPSTVRAHVERQLT